MKKTAIILLALTALLAAGCNNDTPLYDGPDFISFSNETITKSVKEGEEGIIEVPVGVSRTAPVDRTFRVEIDAEKSTATEGLEYQIPSKEITVPAGAYQGILEIRTNYENLTPEEVKLTLKLVSDNPEMLQEGTTTAVTIILNRFFEVTMEWLTGEWTAHNDEDTENYSMQIEQIDDSHVKIIGLFGLADAQIEAAVDYDKSLLLIEPQQYMFTHSEIGDTYLFHVVGNSLLNDDIPGYIDYQGITIGTYGILNAEYRGWYPITTRMEKN